MTTNVPKGLYRNTLGAELRVNDTANHLTLGLPLRTLAGDIAIAVSEDTLLGLRDFYLVTEASLADCGYKLVEPEGTRLDDSGSLDRLADEYGGGAA